MEEEGEGRKTHGWRGEGRIVAARNHFRDRHIVIEVTRTLPRTRRPHSIMDVNTQTSPKVASYDNRERRKKNF